MATFRRRKLKTAPRRFARWRADPGAEGQPPRRRRGIYLLPNAFTTAALFSGFFAIVQGMNLRFEAAGVAIFVAMVLDSLDGRVARMTNTQSDFGAEYDSLSDMVAFGAAPALVIYEWSLRGLGRWGWLAAFVYVAGAALRLARFNTTIATGEKGFFQGLPSPAAAAMVAGFVWAMDDLSFAGDDFRWVSWAITLYAGLSMVSNSPFWSGKTLDLRRSVPFAVVVILVLVFVAISSYPSKVLFGLFVLYGLSGHALWAWRKLTKLRARRAVEPRP